MATHADVQVGAMTGKRKASEGLLHPCSRNEKSIDADEKVVCNKSICETKNEQLCGIPLAICSQTTKSGAIFVLDKASLVLAHVGKRYQILSSDDHADYLRKKKLNPYDYRPDIVHEVSQLPFLLIWESRLHMLGRVKAVCIRTDDGALIKIEPNTLIPESLTEFCHMMAMLRQKLFIKVKGKREKLLRLVENPVTKHLPVNSRKIGLSFSSQYRVNSIGDYVNSIGSHEDVVFVVGTMAYGKIESNYIEDLISVSDCHLSASSCLSSICIAMERKWNIH